jgi:cytochrome c oxidase assembly protein subunit 15
MTAPAPRREPWVGAWLLLITGLVAAMVLVGGATRLTDSGLSITEWNFAKQIVPPLTAAGWEEEFNLYRATTEYQLQNRDMSLAAFKAIYGWEWAHRFFGKVIGAVFAAGFLLFWAQGRLQGRFWPTLALFALGGLQGYVGWWMVESGLAGRLDVAPERLATHLGMAFAILAASWLLALGALGWPRAPSSLGAPRRAAWGLVGVLFLQILTGALVAGVDAGRAFTDWPTINGVFAPQSLSLITTDFAAFLHDHAALQFVHRTLGYGVAFLAIVIAGAALTRGVGPGRAVGLIMGAVALAQAGLGISAILLGAPLWISLIHQGGAIVLWLAALTAAHAAWR